MEMTSSSPLKSSLLAPFSTSSSLILVANSSAVRSLPFTVFRGLEYSRNREDPLMSRSASTDNRYFTTLDMPRAAAMTRGYSSLPVLEDRHLPTSPDAAHLLYSGAIVETDRSPTSALGTFGSAPCRSTSSFAHFKMTDSWTCLARTTSTRNVPPVRTRRLTATGSYSFNNLFSTEKDRRFLEEWARSASSSTADSFRDRRRL
mmetsp:Transcript_26349/g.56016  ORF Transcript_26349/g.56016 Transcript_26349/m.56016 type:complete len:203 (-) Transcript_26349:24-632(-)